jgi:hypothetical protein
VLNDLKNKSHNAPLWNDEFGDLSVSRPPAIILKDPHAAKVFEDLLPKGSKDLKKSSKEMTRRSSRRKSMSKELFMGMNNSHAGSFQGASHDEDGSDDGSGAGRPKGHPTSVLLGGMIPEEYEMPDILKAQGRLNTRPTEPLETLVAESLNDNQPPEIAEALNDEALEKEVLRFPWLRSIASDDDVRPAYPDISDQLPPALSHALANVFSNEELETVYDMFQEYTFMSGEIDVIARHDCQCCLFWVGVNPNKNIVEFCDMQAETARVSQGQDKMFDDEGGVVYPLEAFMRWQLNYRLRHKEDWVLRAGFPERVCVFIKDRFGRFDTGGGLKTRQVFELLGELNNRPTSIEDQKRVIGYIALTDVDKSGTIDFYEFLQLLRLVMEHDTNVSRAREMSLVKACRFSPFEVDALREVYDQFDLQRQLQLGLQQLKRLFEKGPQGGMGRAITKDEVKSMQLILKSVEHKAKKAFHGDQEIKGCSERMSVDFGEFTMLTKEILDHRTVDLVKQISVVVQTRSGLEKFCGRRRPYPDELRGRWELKMFERHTHVFFRRVMEDSYYVTPRSDEKPQIPIFDPEKVPAYVRSKAKFDPNTVTWKLLEDSEDPEPPPPPKKDSKASKKISK